MDGSKLSSMALISISLMVNFLCTFICLFSISVSLPVKALFLIVVQIQSFPNLDPSQDIEIGDGSKSHLSLGEWEQLGAGKLFQLQIAL